MNVNFKPREFFDWREYRDAGLICEGGISIINGGRNIGKTTGSFIRWLEEANTDEMIMFVRNTLKEIEAYRKSFNAQFSTQWYMTANEIWTLERIELLNKKTQKVEIQYRKKDVIGFVASLNGTDGWRSANFAKIKYVYSDEYNQIGNSLDAEKFITLWTSILRTKQNVYTLIVGNRDHASAELLIELGIDLLVPEGYQGDWIVPILPNDKEFGNKAWFIDLDDSRFTNNNVPTIWKAIGRTTEKMGKYYDRGYKSYDNIDCKRLRDETLAMVKWDWSYSYSEYRMIAGRLEDLTIIHLDIHNEYEPKTKYSDIPTSYKKRGFTPLEKDYQHVFFYLTNAIKNESVIYTSIAVKEQAHMFIDDIAYEIDKATFNL